MLCNAIVCCYVMGYSFVEVSHLLLCGLQKYYTKLDGVKEKGVGLEGGDLYAIFTSNFPQIAWIQDYWEK